MDLGGIAVRSTLPAVCTDDMARLPASGAKYRVVNHQDQSLNGLEGVALRKEPNGSMLLRLSPGREISVSEANLEPYASMNRESLQLGSRVRVVGPNTGELHGLIGSITRQEEERWVIGLADGRQVEMEPENLEVRYRA
jgi:RNase P/RNase MRP subunit p29